jgi:hypothetical protein
MEYINKGSVKIISNLNNNFSGYFDCGIKSTDINAEL